MFLTSFVSSHAWHPAFLSQSFFHIFCIHLNFLFCPLLFIPILPLFISTFEPPYKIRLTTRPTWKSTHDFPFIFFSILSSFILLLIVPTLWSSLINICFCVFLIFPFLSSIFNISSVWHTLDITEIKWNKRKEPMCPVKKEESPP